MVNHPQEFLPYGVIKNAGHFYSIKNNPTSIFSAIGVLSLDGAFHTYNGAKNRSLRPFRNFICCIIIFSKMTNGAIFVQI